MNLYKMFLFAVERFPDHQALVQGDKRFTYLELSYEVNRIASALHKLGLKPHDQVMVMLKNRIETIVVFWAVQRLGAVFTPINLRSSAEDILYCVNDLETKFIVFEEAVKHLVLKQKFNGRPFFIGLEEGVGDISYRDLLKSGSTELQFKFPLISEDDLAVILYTSGTSGNPKGVPRTHKNEYSATIAHIIQCGYQMFDRTLGIPALSHTIGLRSLLAMTFLNGSYVALPDFDFEESLMAITQENISCLFMTPTMYHDLVFHPEAKHTDFSSIHSIAFSGSPMSEELIQKCDELIKPQYFVNHYGSSEIFTFTFFSDVRKKPGCAGKPGFHQRIKLINLDWEHQGITSVSTKGEIGEILVEMDSAEAFKGYWNRPDATRKAIKQGWYFTGDVGFFDEDGDLHVVGRVDDMILSGGENIYPQEVGKVLSEHPGVREVVVVGEVDKRWGEIVTAYIVPESTEITPQELDHFCKVHKRLPNYKRPRKYVFISEVPRNSAGKVLRRKLRDGNYTELTPF
ncbi:class I adenylate-forming enzyme family protein [Bacillus sp. V5-8f]|uniref:class I adenylate-forming enzyme family protein n=1 Tax=Bacillus sp. V5-8f TaxID=2053044 RepID=UPI000C782F49|nr:AMP-binding protein [Bacillus sp. V5-8f]PLT32719.1 4-chlorobenzoate--CoA ligase [Bacillus sp. V5-8f]